ncbi:MAG TPA: hypothetical protein VEI26_13820 [Terriglobales bacterium]|nr:hypothetical protein [Terriglobales bacterium]
MSVGIDKTRKHDSASAIDLNYSLPIFIDPRVAPGVSGFSDGDYLSGIAQDSGIFNDSKFFELRTAPRTGNAGGRSQRKKLANVDQEQSL